MPLSPNSVSRMDGGGCFSTCGSSLPTCNKKGCHFLHIAVVGNDNRNPESDVVVIVTPVDHLLLHEIRIGNNDGDVVVGYDGGGPGKNGECTQV